MICSGDQGCYASLIDIGSQSLRTYCSGWQSCSEATIIGATSRLFCSNTESCSNTDISGILQLTVEGTRAIEGSTITNSGVNGPVMVISLDAWDAVGSGATVECNGEPLTCSISCTGVSCANLNLVGDGEFSVSCDDNQITCPNGIERPSPFDCPADCPSVVMGANVCPCNENPNCEDCENWGCAECQDGYFYKNFATQCISCVDTFGPECLRCNDWQGCVECEDGYIRVWDNECQLAFCSAL